VHLYPVDGAVQRVGSDETAWNFRDAAWSMVIAGIDPDPTATESSPTGRRYWVDVHPYTMGGAYVSFMMDEGQDRVRATYGYNYERRRSRPPTARRSCSASTRTSPAVCRRRR